MISGLDHIAIAAAAMDAAAQSYELLLGRRAARADGGGQAVFRLANVRLALQGLDGRSEGLSSLAFAVDDMEKAARLLAQRALPVRKTDTGMLEIDSKATHGVSIALCARDNVGTASPLAQSAEAAAVSGLDHVVIRSPNPERAIALYAGRFGLSLRLDRTEPAWGARLIFFRCGDLIIEVVHDLKAGIGDGQDCLWGLSWRVPSIAEAHARLRNAGVEVSDIRTGRRPGTQVFTVKSHTAGVPTLLIGPRPD
jgi:catechol 2,3-dioxygenase-like lactoylglutathione lyase family enzyme